MSNGILRPLVLTPEMTEASVSERVIADRLYQQAMANGGLTDDFFAQLWKKLTSAGINYVLLKLPAEGRTYYLNSWLKKACRPPSDTTVVPSAPS